MQVQISLMSDKGYRPMSTIIEVKDAHDYNTHKTEYQKKAVFLICARRHMTVADLKKYGYTQIAQREYDKAKIDRENAERYERIKQERGWGKYAKKEGATDDTEK